MPKIIEHPQIKGLYYCPKFLSRDEHDELLEIINDSDWSNELRRRVQHYGYKYNYIKGRIDENDAVGAFPEYVAPILNDLKNLNLNLPDFDQMIINEYKKGQAISAHCDCVPCFTDGIVSITLGCKGIMTFSTYIDKKLIECDIELEPRSAVILTKDARYTWKHEISTKKNGHFTVSNPRISLTLRKCIFKK